MTQDLNGKSIVGLTAQTYGTRLAVLTLSLGANILIARLLGPEGKGYIATSLLWAGLLASVLAFGLDNTTLFFLGKSPSIFGRLLGLFLPYSLLAMALGASGLYLLNTSTGLFAERPALLWPTAGLIWTAILMLLLNALLLGIGRLPFTNLVSLIGSVLYLMLLVGATWAQIRDPLTVLWGILALQSILVLISGIRAIFLSRPYQEKAVKWQELVKYALRVYAGTLAGLLYLRSNFMILSLMAPVAEIGIYSVAQILGDLVLILPMTLNSLLLPKVAGMSKEYAAQRVSEVARFSIAATLAIAVVVGLGASVVIPLAFGQAFERAVGMVGVLSLGAWVAAGGLIMAIYFNGINRPGIPSLGAWIGFLTTAVLALLMVPRWGGYGAAWGLTAARFIVTGFMLILFLRTTRGDPREVILMTRHDWERGLGLLRGMRS